MKRPPLRITVGIDPAIDPFLQTGSNRAEHDDHEEKRQDGPDFVIEPAHSAQGHPQREERDEVEQHEQAGHGGVDQPA